MDAERTYVRLSHDQRQLQNVTPGELNEAINIDQIHGRICEQCGQPLPATYTPPSDEEWMTGIFGCLQDTDSCMNGLFCPCVVFGQNVAALTQEIPEQQACIGHAICVEGGITLAALTATCSGVIDPDTVCLLTEGLLFAWWVCAIYAGMGRQLLQRKYHLKDSPCDPCLVHCALHWCAICQEHREMRRHLTERASSATTVVDPPEVQEMNAMDKPDTGLSWPSREGVDGGMDTGSSQPSQESVVGPDTGSSQPSQEGVDGPDTGSSQPFLQEGVDGPDTGSSQPSREGGEHNNVQLQPISARNSTSQ